MIPSPKVFTVCLTEAARARENSLDLVVVASSKTALGGLISLAGWSSSVWTSQRLESKLHGSTFERQVVGVAATVYPAYGPLYLFVND